jgi:hypothetical protein
MFASVTRRGSFAIQRKGDLVLTFAKLRLDERQTKRRVDVLLCLSRNHLLAATEVRLVQHQALFGRERFQLLEMRSRPSRVQQCSAIMRCIAQ